MFGKRFQLSGFQGHLTTTKLHLMNLKGKNIEIRVSLTEKAWFRP